MDIVFTNKIATHIHSYCINKYGTPETYTEDPIRFRQNIQNCFLNVLEQHRQVMNGIEIFVKAHPSFK